MPRASGHRRLTIVTIVWRLNPYEEQMDSTPFGDVKPVTMPGLATPQDIEIDRGSHGRVSGDGGG
jgi:hypothetical protein